jgi:hypothetical protein
LGLPQLPQRRVGLDGDRTSVKQISCLHLSSFGICDSLVVFELLCRFSVLHIISSRYLQLGLKIGIKRSKFGAASVQLVNTGRVRYFCLVLILFDLCSKSCVAGL